MSENIANEIIKEVAVWGVPQMIDLIITTYVKPKLKKNTKDSNSILEEKLSEYLRRSYNKYLYMNTIVFKNQQKTIDDLYIPLTVSKRNIKPKVGYANILINKFPDNFIPLYTKVLLIDNAGMGKSTIIKYLYLEAIKQNKGIPILIELRRLGQDDVIIDFITNEISNIRKKFDNDDVYNLIEGGEFIFFFDGYDEIVEESKGKITDALREFISKAEKNMFIISSREESSLSCFGDFQRFDIKPLRKEEAYDLICKYDNNGELSKQLITKLENEENLKIINEFLTNPLMVSLLYKAFEYKSNVPYKKSIFYRQVYDALFEDHDRSKGGAYVHPKKSNLDIEDFYRILRILGFLTLKEGITYSKEKLIEILKRSKQYATGIEFKENDFIYDITYSVPLLLKEGTEYKWIHKSFQEYFAASYICIDAKENQSKYLSQMISNKKMDRYYNILDFCYDIDYKEFRKVIIYPTIKKFIEYYENSYTDEPYENYNAEDLDVRKNLNFIYENTYIIKIDKAVPSIDEQLKYTKEKFKEIFRGWKYVSDKNAAMLISNTGICVGYLKGYTNRILLKLLSSKQSPIIKKDIHTKSKRYSENIFNQLVEGEHLINENPANILNNHEIFGEVNRFLIEYLPQGDGTNLIFDYAECVKFKKEIEEEIKFEKENKLFL
ncbi:hypothetical protein KQI88_15875 [Alkaliphilus sp. MSJ-5]|uniref:Short NACHT-associated C-terminal domain-containing protein n=1 Tax=Alkaliphilus flagellatus TaxID=2841507 RepID=A0ABS6G940_9FIRM|nr:NACHT domain-containing protein [Alkaliphilus flagellatus]MBU5677896.1 hypothetical protein [Alkaliphilus flagellatus]